jgi:hypothetical protein
MTGKVAGCRETFSKFILGTKTVGKHNSCGKKYWLDGLD